MKSFGFHSFADPGGRGLNDCSIERTDIPLAVNCAGVFSTRFPFVTDNKNGRLDHYLMYIASGSLTLFNGDEELMAKENDLVLFPPQQRYKYSYLGGKELTYYWVHFTGSEAESRLAEYGLSYLPTVHKAYLSNHIPQRFSSIFNAFGNQDGFRDRELAALLDRLLVSAARAVAGNTGTSPLSESVKYISSSYNTDIKIPELAAMEHLSVSRYNFLFKKRFGVPPQKYILQLRMSSAKDLLASTDLTVKQIGIMCGYSDSHFFSKTFKLFCGISPSEYRNGTNIE